MKKVILTLAIALAALSVSNTASAQDTKMWVGGQVSLMSHSQAGGSSYTSYAIVPEFGYQLQPNLALAIDLGIQSTGHGNTGLVVAPFARYSFLKGSLVSAFVDGGVTYTSTSNTGQTSGNQLFVGLRPGVAIKVTSNIALTAIVGGLGYWSNKDAGVTTSSFGLDFDMTAPMVGVAYKF